MLAILWLTVKSLWAKAVPMLSPYAATLIKWGAIGVTVLGILAGYKHAGRVAEQAEQLEQAVKDAKRNAKIDAEPRGSWADIVNKL